MDVKKLGGCLHKLGVKYDRPLFELATKAFDEDQSGLIEFDEFVEMFATLRASDELALGDFGAPSAELTAQELSDVKASFDAIDADGSGAIDEGEVKTLFEKVGLDATDKEIRGLVSFLDADGSGEVELGVEIRLLRALTFVACEGQDVLHDPLHPLRLRLDRVEALRNGDLALDQIQRSRHSGPTTRRIEHGHRRGED